MNGRLGIAAVWLGLFLALMVVPGWAREKAPTLRELKEAVALHPADPEAHYSLGLQYEMQGQTQKAAKAYQKAVTLKPDYAEALASLGRVKGDLGDYDEAIKALKQAARLKPDSKEARTRLSEMYNRQGLALGEKEYWPEAIRAFQAAIRSNPDMAEAARNNLGVAYFNEGRLSEAKAAFEEVLSGNPTNAQARYNLGVAYMLSGDPKAAYLQYLMLKDLDPVAAGQLSYLMFLPQKKGDYIPQEQAPPFSIRSPW